MFLWFPVLDLARAPRRTARKKGSGYENGLNRDYEKFRMSDFENNGMMTFCDVCVYSKT
jgi:hypothetical protein